MSKNLRSVFVAAAAVSVASGAGRASEYAGTWQCQMELTGRKIPLTLELEEQDGKLGGKVTVPAGTTPLLAPVLLDDGSLYLTVEFAGWAEVDFEYSISGDSLEGSWDSGTDSGRFLGKRPPEER